MDRVNPTHPDPITCLARIGEARSTRVEIWTQASTRVESWWQKRARVEVEQKRDFAYVK